MLLFCVIIAKVHEVSKDKILRTNIVLYKIQDWYGCRFCYHELLFYVYFWSTLTTVRIISEVMLLKILWQYYETSRTKVMFCKYCHNVISFLSQSQDSKLAAKVVILYDLIIAITSTETCHLLTILPLQFIPLTSRSKYNHCTVF